jgi:hypothetical protein
MVQRLSTVSDRCLEQPNTDGNIEESGRES